MVTSNSSEELSDSETHSLEFNCNQIKQQKKQSSHHEQLSKSISLSKSKEIYLSTSKKIQSKVSCNANKQQSSFVYQNTASDCQNLNNSQLNCWHTKSQDTSRINNIQIAKTAIYKQNPIKQGQKLKIRIKRFSLQQAQSPNILLKPQIRIKPKLGNGQFPPQSTILLTTWNVNGIRFSISKNHLSYYINQTKPDILCLTETKMDELSFNKQPLTVFGYNGYWNFCKCSLGYSGVVVFSKFQPIRVIEGIREKLFVQQKQTKQKQKLQSINTSPEQQQQNYGDDFDKQGRVLTLEFKDFYLVTVYTPAAGKELQRLNYKCKQFEPRLFAFCEYLMTKKQVIIAGDLNTALTQLDTHITKNTFKGPAFTLMERQTLQGFINKNNLIDTYRFKNPTKKQFTWWHIKYFGRQYAIGKRLDYFLLTEGLKRAIVNSEIKEKFKGSDHSPVQLKLDLRKI